MKYEAQEYLEEEIEAGFEELEQLIEEHHLRREIRQENRQRPDYPQEGKKLP